MSAPLRILVAEDNEEDAHLLRCAFERARMDASVYFVKDGQELIDYLEGRSPFADPVAHPLPTLLLLDLELPRVSGLEALVWLRRQARLQKLTVVVLSGSERPKDIGRARELGVLDCLAKPRHPGDLVGILRELELLWRKITSPPVSPVPPEQPTPLAPGFEPQADSPVI